MAWVTYALCTWLMLLFPRGQMTCWEKSSHLSDQTRQGGTALFPRHDEEVKFTPEGRRGGQDGAGETTRTEPRMLPPSRLSAPGTVPAKRGKSTPGGTRKGKKQHRKREHPHHMLTGADRHISRGSDINKRGIEAYLQETHSSVERVTRTSGVPSHNPGAAVTAGTASARTRHKRRSTFPGGGARRALTERRYSKDEGASTTVQDALGGPHNATASSGAPENWNSTVLQVSDGLGAAKSGDGKVLCADNFKEGKKGQRHKERRKKGRGQLRGGKTGLRKALLDLSKDLARNALRGESMDGRHASSGHSHPQKIEFNFFIFEGPISSNSVDDHSNSGSVLNQEQISDSTALASDNATVSQTEAKDQGKGGSSGWRRPLFLDSGQSMPSPSLTSDSTEGGNSKAQTNNPTPDNTSPDVPADPEYMHEGKV